MPNFKINNFYGLKKNLHFFTEFTEKWSKHINVNYLFMYIMLCIVTFFCLTFPQVTGGLFMNSQIN